MFTTNRFDLVICLLKLTSIFVSLFHLVPLVITKVISCSHTLHFPFHSIFKHFLTLELPQINPISVKQNKRFQGFTPAWYFSMSIPFSKSSCISMQLYPHPASVFPFVIITFRGMNATELIYAV